MPFNLNSYPLSLGKKKKKNKAHSMIHFTFLSKGMRFIKDNYGD